jgi:hypothetical protein
MAVSVISTRPPEVISNRPAGNTAEPGKPLFPDFRGYFRGHEDGGQVDITGAPGLWPERCRSGRTGRCRNSITPIPCRCVPFYLETPCRVTACRSELAISSRPVSVRAGTFWVRNWVRGNKSRRSPRAPCSRSGSTARVSLRWRDWSCRRRGRRGTRQLVADSAERSDARRQRIASVLDERVKLFEKRRSLRFVEINLHQRRGISGSRLYPPVVAE